jgi:MYXO-CTERM domain-containing protein
MALSLSSRSMGRVSVFLAALAVLVLVFWAISGAALVTQYQVATTQQVEDEFGDLVEKTVLEEGFKFGLLPDKGYDGAAPIAGGLGAVAGALFFLSRRRREDGASTTEGQDVQ